MAIPLVQDAARVNQLMENLICPITFDIIEDPLVHSLCGTSFSEQPITEWIEAHGSCPQCRNNADMAAFTPNHLLREAVAEMPQRVLNQFQEIRQENMEQRNNLEHQIQALQNLLNTEQIKSRAADLERERNESFFCRWSPLQDLKRSYNNPLEGGAKAYIALSAVGVAVAAPGGPGFVAAAVGYYGLAHLGMAATRVSEKPLKFMLDVIQG